MLFKKKEEYVTEYGTGYIIKKSEAVEKKILYSDGRKRDVYFSVKNVPKWDEVEKSGFFFSLGCIPDELLKDKFYKRMEVTEDGEPIGYVKEESEALSDENILGAIRTMTTYTADNYKKKLKKLKKKTVKKKK